MLCQHPSKYANLSTRTGQEDHDSMFHIICFFAMTLQKTTQRVTFFKENFQPQKSWSNFGFFRGYAMELFFNVFSRRIITSERFSNGRCKKIININQNHILYIYTYYIPWDSNHH